MECVCHGSQGQAAFASPPPPPLQALTGSHSPPAKFGGRSPTLRQALAMRGYGVLGHRVGRGAGTARRAWDAKPLRTTRWRRCGLASSGVEWACAGRQGMGQSLDLKGVSASRCLARVGPGTPMPRHTPLCGFGGVAQGLGGWLCWLVAAPTGLSPLNLLL